MVIYESHAKNNALSRRRAFIRSSIPLNSTKIPTPYCTAWEFFGAAVYRCVPAHRGSMSIVYGMRVLRCAAVYRR